MYRSDFAKMPKLDGRAAQLYKSISGSEYDHFNQTIAENPPPDRKPDIEFAHRLFHDAESTFWVIAWCLARYAPKDYLLETKWTSDFRSFLFAMRHQPSSDHLDYRLSIFPNWEDTLHPAFSETASMLYQMHIYIFPEWGFRPKLDAEHVHEALMRLLLKEIIRIDDTQSNVEFHSQTRALPPT